MKLRAPKGEGALTLEDLDGHVGGLVALAGRALLDAERHGVGGLLDRLVGIFGRANVYVELQRHLLRDEERDNETLVALAEAFRVPVVATNGVRFAAPDDAAALRRAHLHPPPHHAGAGRAAAGRPTPSAT